ncbi:MAG: hypothetical protein WDO16_19360 [Bacteroidota bacterium]
MKAELIIHAPQVTPAASSLHNIVNLIAGSMEQAANDNKSFIINDVPEDILIDTNEDLLASGTGQPYE